MEGIGIDSSPVKALFDTVVKNEHCIGCGACASVENSPIKIKLDEFGRYRPFIVSGSESMDVNVQTVCPFSDQSRNEDELGSSLFAEHGVYDDHLGYVAATYAGYVNEGDFRTNGSSGGIGSWILVELLKKGLVDNIIHVHPTVPSAGDRTLFHYSISSSEEEVKRGARSHYYPVELSGILKHVRERPGNYAIVGIPCFLKAIRLLMRQDSVFAERIKYCIGLVCGYLPSTKFADLFAWQAGIHPNELIQINFRKKDAGQPANRYSVEINGVKAIPFGSTFGSNWGNGFFKHKACDYCDDVVSETADITIGDAWLPKYMADSQGTNIVIVRNPDMNRVIMDAKREGRLQLEPLTREEVIESQAPAFRHRREGLAYRLHMTKEWHPPKRVKAKPYRINFIFRKMHEYRVRMARESHVAFQEAMALNDLKAFERRMTPHVKKYRLYLAISHVLRKLGKVVRGNLYPRPRGYENANEPKDVPSPKVITIVNHVDSLNLGDASLLYMTVTLVEKVFHPDQIYVISFNLENDDHLIALLKHAKVKFLQSTVRVSGVSKVRMLGEILQVLVRALYVRISGKVTDPIATEETVLNALRSSRLVIVRGGDNLADTYGIGSLAAQLYNMLLAMILKKRLIVLSTSIGPFKRKILRKLASLFLKKSHLIVVRDMKSRIALQREGIDERRIQFIPDIAFDLPVIHDENHDHIFNDANKACVGLCISALTSKYIEKDRLAIILAELCDHIISKHGRNVILIPHVLSQFNDEMFASHVYSRLKRKDDVYVIHETNPMKIKHVISKLQLLISFRMHPIIHAISMGVPVIGIDYNDKAAELMKLVSMEKWVVQVQDLDKLRTLVDQFFEVSMSDKICKTEIRPNFVSEEYTALLKRVAQGLEMA